MSKAQLNYNNLFINNLYDDPEDAFDLNKILSDEKARKVVEEWAERTIAKGLKEKNAQVFEKLTKYKVVVKDEKGQEIETYLDPDKAKAALTFMETEGKDFQEKLEKAVTEANNRSEVRIKTLANELDTYKNQFGTERMARYGEKIGYELRDALRTAGIKEGKLPLHERYLSEFVTIESDGGKESITIKDPDGNLRYGKKGPMTLEEFVFEYRDSEDISDDFYPVGESGGSGGVQGKPYKGVTQGAIDQKLPPATRMQMYRAQQAAMKARR